MVPGGRPLIAIGYKYNARKFLSFVVTGNAGIKKTGITYLYKYPDQFTNVAIHPVATPFVDFVIRLIHAAVAPSSFWYLLSFIPSFPLCISMNG